MTQSRAQNIDIAILRAAIAALASEEVNIVLTTVRQPMPKEFKELPENFRYMPFVPGLAMAEQADLFIHHGRHGSSLTG